MNKCYIMIIEEGIKTFSLIGHGNDFKISFAVRGQTAPLSGLRPGDRIAGYISNGKKMFAYLFQAKEPAEGSSCVIEKVFESAAGPSLEAVDDDVKHTVLSHEQTESLFPITEEQYHKIVTAMLSQCMEEFGPKTPDAEYRQRYAIDESKRLKGGANVLLYGVPGCGKSFTVTVKYCKGAGAVERVVFHPDYTYGDFAGQILPLTDTSTGKIRYEFSPGPFTRILSDAYNNPEKKYCLVIEEINRGNAPAIFGDIFHLLDRNEDGSGTHEITNADIAGKVYLHGQTEHTIKLPSNLSIIATMNTSDQNVFTLDTAFQRRCNMRMVENDVHKSKLAQKNVLDTSIKWAAFHTAINDLILAKNAGMTSSEDKRLGAYFVTQDDLRFHTASDHMTQEEADDRNHSFPEKVLKYLWDDAFKFTRDEVFKREYDSLEKLIHAFEAAQGDNRFSIFIDDIFRLNPDG